MKPPRTPTSMPRASERDLRHEDRRSPRRFAVWLFALLLAAPAGAQDPAAERLWLEAQRREAAGDRAGAVEEYSLLAQQFPDDRLAPGALLASAEILRQSGAHGPARENLERLLEKHPRTPEAARAFVLQARLLIDGARSPIQLEEARAELRRVPLLYGPERYPDPEARAWARVSSGELGRLLGDAKGAGGDFLSALEDEPIGPWTARAQLGLGQALLDQELWAAGAEVLQDLVAERAELPESEEPRARAARLLTLVHRLVLRPASGQSPWARDRPFPRAEAGLRSPEGIAASEDGRVVLVDPRLEQIAVYGAGGESLASRAARTEAHPFFSSDGVAHAAIDGAILRPETGQRAEMIDPRPNKDESLREIRAGARGLFGEFFLLAKGFRGLLRYGTPDRGVELALGGDRPDFVDLARGASGSIYLLDARAGEVHELGAAGDVRGAVVRGEWKKPVALDVDALGNVYVLDRGERRVEIFDRRGQLLTRIGPRLDGGLELRSPSDLAVDGSGRLFVADERLGQIRVFE